MTSILPGAGYSPKSEYSLTDQWLEWVYSTFPSPDAPQRPEKYSQNMKHLLEENLRRNLRKEITHLLMRRGPAAEDRVTLLSQTQEVTLQRVIQSKAECCPVHHQCYLLILRSKTTGILSDGVYVFQFTQNHVTCHFLQCKWLGWAKGGLQF